MGLLCLNYNVVYQDSKIQGIQTNITEQVVVLPSKKNFSRIRHTYKQWLRTQVMTFSTCNTSLIYQTLPHGDIYDFCNLEPGPQLVELYRTNEAAVNNVLEVTFAP